MSKKLSRFIFLIVILQLLLPNLLLAENGLYYHYFKEKISLNLSKDEILVHKKQGVSKSDIAKSLRGIGISEEDIKEHPMKDRLKVNVPPGRESTEGIRNLIADLALKDEILFASPSFISDDGQNRMRPLESIIVGFNDNVSDETAELIIWDYTSGNTIGTVTDFPWANMRGVYRIKSYLKNGFDILDLANTLAQLPEVKFAEPDMLLSGQGSLIPNDPGFSNCWGIHNTGQSGGTADMDMDGPEAWDVTTGDDSIIVVVLDTGVQQDHPDIHQIPGADFTSDGGDGGPVNRYDNHGTAVAGCISATINNSLGTVGIAPGCRVASARTFIATSSSGSWTSSASWTVDALTWAESIGARVTNNSNRYGFTSSSIETKYDQTRENGIVHFAAAGNSSSSKIDYPAKLLSVNAVASLDRDGDLSSFSNYGTGLAFSAPGRDIYTTDRTGSDGWTSGDYTTASGTSFASPYAAGVAALVLSADSSLTAAEVEQIMQESSMDLGAAGYDTTYGWGMVNAYSAVSNISHESDTDPPTPDPMTFVVAPHSTSDTSIAMTATPATDPSGVEYYFTCFSTGGHNSGWQASPTYEDIGLEPETTYSYDVTARDKSVNQNQTAPSTVASATTEEINYDDAPYSDIRIQGVVSGSYVDTYFSDNVYESIQEVVQGHRFKGFSSLEHKWLFDIDGGNEVLFFIEAWHSVSVDGDDFTFAYSINDIDYVDLLTVTKTTDDNALVSALIPSDISGTVYIRVTDKDSTRYNTDLDTLYIDRMFIRSNPGQPDTTAPEPNPMTWAAEPQATGSRSITMTATAAIDDSGAEYYFTCFSGDGHDSGWQASPIYEDTGLQPNTTYTYTVKARDLSANQNETLDSSQASATTDDAPDLTMHISQIEMKLNTRSAGKNTFTSAQATVTVVDSGGATVEGATVEGTWSGATSDSDVGITSSAGIVTLSSDEVKNAASGTTFTFTVDNISKSGWTHIPGETSSENISVN